MGISKKDEQKKISLTEKRLEEYKHFRRNLRLLRNSTGLSAEELGKNLGFVKYHRVVDLEYGRATEPKLDEVKSIASYFGISIDQLLNKKSIIHFVDPTISCPNCIGEGCYVCGGFGKIEN